MKKVHFIGVSGIGMSAVAVMLKQMGWQVTGSDEAYYPPASTYLKEAGIAIFEGYRPQNIPDDVDTIVLGRNAKLSPETNEEVRAALASGVRIQSFPEVLGEIAREKHAIVVAGSFGKSTATAMLSFVMRACQKDPSYFVGAVSPSLPSTAHVGADNYFILEGDEYPTSQTDDRSKFLHYRARDVIFTGAVHDHVNVFPTIESYEAPFIALLHSLPEHGVVFAAYEPEVLSVLNKAGKNAVTYSAYDEAADWYATDITYGETTTFTIMRHKEKVVDVTFTLLGQHNIKHAVGTMAYLVEQKICSPDEVAQALRTFKGVRRRLDNVAPRSRVPVFEGFGSSHEKTMAARRAIQQHFPKKRLVIIFEPHTFGLRNRANLYWYDTLFDGAQLVFIAPPETQGATTHDQLSHEEIVNRVRASHVVVKPFMLHEDDADAIVDMLEENDVVLILTSGNMQGLVELLPEKITKKFPQ
jgi:UDP-N-acetylmuramate: L-alanyl-gamma-D-glutamyl-meso-diaminopimelate ligase